jgi:superfamily I DNA/RNA helicase
MKLPSYQDLSKEQDAINDLPLEGSYVVTGPPGTGKTVMALYRTQMLTKAAAPVQLLVYSRLLSQYVENAVEELDLDGSVKTFHSWFWNFYRDLYVSSPPSLDRWVYDWSEILSRVSGEPPARAKLPFLIVDEGQDLPKEFYMVGEYLSKNVTVFADENQKLTRENSTLADIRLYSGISSETYELRKNYRNTFEIAQLARHFCVDTKNLPELPTRRRERPSVRRHASLAETVDFIRTTAKNNDDLQIGVFTQKESLQYEICRRLEALRVPCQFYKGGRGARATAVDFEASGVFVVNYPSAKGLEFDIVILPELQSVSLDVRNPETRMLFYVLTSRARDELYLCYSGEGEPAIIADLPADLVSK